MRWETESVVFGELVRDELAPLMRFTNPVAMMGMVEDSLQENERIKEVQHRQEVHNMLRGNMRADGKVAIYVWERDCDGVEATHITWIEAKLATYMQLIDELYDNAEGPVYTFILSQDQAQTFVPTWRDTYAEAAGY